MTHSTDPLTQATDQIRTLINRKTAPLSPLAAIFQVTEAMSTEDATQVLDRLIAQRFLSVWDADMAQMLATRLGVEVHWSHATFVGDGEWMEGRGS